MRNLIRRFDSFLRGRLGVFEFSDDPECLFRVRVIQAPHDVHLKDGEVKAGTPILELHLWNEHIPPIPRSGPDLAWAVLTQHRTKVSFQMLACQMQHDPRLAGVQALGGVTVLLFPGEGSEGKKLFKHLGFAVYPYHNPLGRFGEFWENFYSWWIMWTFNAASLRHRQLIHLRRAEMWMSVRELSRRYGANKTEKGSSDDNCQNHSNR